MLSHRFLFAVLMSAGAVAEAAYAAFPNARFPASFSARAGTQVTSIANGPLVVRPDGSFSWPGVSIRPAGRRGVWDWSGVGEVSVVVSNGSDRAEYIHAAVVGEGMSLDVAPARSSRVPAGGVRTITIPLADSPWVTDVPVKLKGMQGRIGSKQTLLDFTRTERVDVYQTQGERPYRTTFAVLDIGTAFAARRPKVIPAAEFFPFVDRYGQFRHGEWPGKIRSDAELASARAGEEAWLKANANGPVRDADRFGGWTGGPRLEATGFFRTEKIGGKWWFVDPEGRLFFSLGINSIYPGNSTAIAGREKYFEEKYAEREVFFIHRNLERKYGPRWRECFADTLHARFRSWGINTLGNWCWSGGIWYMRRTPYVLTIDYSSGTVFPGWKRCNGRPVPDVGSLKFAADLAERVEAFAKNMKNDPWCLGVFVDNELGWSGCGDKVADAAEKYYSTVRAVLKEKLPNHLYLGSRIHIGIPESAWRAAARHCDVVSHNFYEREPSWDLPPGADDKPMLIGEFHFGSKDNGFFTGACVTVFDRRARGDGFRYFAGKCLDHPRFIGCHWFEYYDQPLTGRGGWTDDSESFNDGFVSVCDVPYPDMVNAARETAAEMYVRRFGPPSR